MSERSYKYLTLRLTPDQHRRIKILAAEQEVTVKDLILHCVQRIEQEQERGEKQEDKDA